MCGLQPDATPRRPARSEPYSIHLMRLVVIMLLMVGLVLNAFSAWGMYTHAGQQRYDEMAGMIPLFAGMAGVVLVGVAGVLCLVASWRSPKERSAPLRG